MNEERRMILEMLKDGQITVDEAERLIEATPAAVSETPRAIALAGQATQPKRILVRVTENGRVKVNVKVPFSLIRAGLKLGKSFGTIGLRYTENFGPDTMAMLQDIDIDEVLDSLSDGEITLPYTVVDVDDVDSGESVLVILE